MRSFALAAGLLVGGALVTRSATLLADDLPSSTLSSAPAAPAAAPSGPWVWYGWQLLASDMLVTAGFVAVPNDARTFFVLAYLADGPVIHLAHGRPAVALVSGILRVSLPLIGGVIGASSTTCTTAQEAAAERQTDGPFNECTFSGLVGAVIGMGVGALTAMVADAAISWERAPAPDSVTSHPVRTSWLVPVVSPMVDSNHGAGLTLGVSGAF